MAQLGARLGAGSPALGRLVRERQDLAAEWVRADERLTAAASVAAAKRDAAGEATLRARQAAIDARMRQIDGELARTFPAFAALAAPQAVPAAEVRQLLAQGEALLVYLTDRRHVHAFLVRRDSIRWHRVALTSREIAEKVQAVRCGLDAADWIGDQRPARCLRLLGRGPENDLLPFDTGIAADLYDALLKPFEADLRGAQILVAASGALTGLPFQALPTVRPKPSAPMKDVKWLVAQSAVTVLPSVASLKTLRRQVRASQATKPFLGIGNPILLGAAGDMSQAWGAQSCLAARLKQRAPGLSLVAKAPPPMASLLRGGRVDMTELRRLEPLPETRDELCAVAQSLGAAEQDLALGSKATETHVRKLDASGQLQAYRVVHFATHGLVAGEVDGVSEPALVLTPPDEPGDEDDGVLTASEVAALRLDADWVILSACNTAAGDEPGAEQLSGLARAFFYSGARSLLVSHWPVQSAAAVKLTTRTLSELQRNRGLTRGEALRRSMVALATDASSPTNAHPQVWAPFVVVGEGSPAAALPPVPASVGPAGATAASAATTPAALGSAATETRPVPAPPRAAAPTVRQTPDDVAKALAPKVASPKAAAAPSPTAVAAPSPQTKASTPAVAPAGAVSKKAPVGEALPWLKSAPGAQPASPPPRPAKRERPGDPFSPVQ